MAEPGRFIERLPDYQARVHAMLDRVLPPASQPPQRLHEAMRYAVLNGGKRIRAILVIATGEALQADAGRLEPPACAVELIHAYSLVHDDLPAMDDDDLRRGLPTCHRAFDEATAILAGDALHTLAFEILVRTPVPGSAPAPDDAPGSTDASASAGVPTSVGGAPASAGVPASAGLPVSRLAHPPIAPPPGVPTSVGSAPAPADAPASVGDLVRTLADASGSRGMAGGQAVDLESVGRSLTLAQLENMHLRKTGALIRASVRLGALSAGADDPALLARLDDYARCIGLAFQIRDDVLDVESDTGTLGKTQGADVARKKPTYPAILGLEASRAHAHALHERAVERLAPLGPGADPLRDLSGFIVSRMH